MSHDEDRATDIVLAAMAALALIFLACILFGAIGCK